MVGLYQRPLAGRLPSGCTGLAGLRPSGRPRGGHPHRGRPLHAGVPDRKSGEQGHRSARAPQFQAFGRTTARQPEQPSRVTPVGPRMAHPMVTSRAYSSRVGRRQRIRGERAETHRKRPGDADRKRWPNGNHRGFRRQQRSGGSAGVPTEGHRRFRPGDRCRVVPRLGQQSHFVGQDGLGNYWAGEPTLTKPLRPACTSN